jgi:hypothetical protein
MTNGPKVFHVVVIKPECVNNCGHNIQQACVKWLQHGLVAVSLYQQMKTQVKVDRDVREVVINSR